MLHKRRQQPSQADTENSNLDATDKNLFDEGRIETECWSSVCRNSVLSMEQQQEVALDQIIAASDRQVLEGIYANAMSTCLRECKGHVSSTRTFFSPLLDKGRDTTRPPAMTSCLQNCSKNFVEGYKAVQKSILAELTASGTDDLQTSSTLTLLSGIFRPHFPVEKSQLHQSLTSREPVVDMRRITKRR